MVLSFFQCGQDSTSEQVRGRVVVRGNVQGVSFGDSCRREGCSGGVARWVSICRWRGEAVFEGDAASVAALVEWRSAGPRGVDVDWVTRCL